METKQQVVKEMISSIFMRNGCRFWDCNVEIFPFSARAKSQHSGELVTRHNFKLSNDETKHMENRRHLYLPREDGVEFSPRLICSRSKLLV